MGEGNLEHDIRFWEAETSMKLGIPFDMEWYSIDVIAREQMIAAWLMDNYIKNIVIEEANQ